MNELHYWECPECRRINPYLQRKCGCGHVADGGELKYKTCTACGCLLPASRLFCDCGKFLPLQKDTITEADVEAAYQAGRFAGIAEERERMAKEQPAPKSEPFQTARSKTQEETNAEKLGMTVEEYRTYLHLRAENEKERAREAERKARAAKPPKDYAALKAILAAVIVILVVLAYVKSPSYDEIQAAPSKQETAPPSVDPTLTPAPFSNGRVVCFPSGDCVAPFTVETNEGENYYILLNPVDNTAKRNGKLAFLVEGGKTVSRDVPLGEYEVFYASGETWYGPVYKFGPNSDLYRCEETFEFTEDEDGTYGWTVTLRAVTNGNLDTERIDWADFPDIEWEPTPGAKI